VFFLTVVEAQGAEMILKFAQGTLAMRALAFAQLARNHQRAFLLVCGERLVFQLIQFIEVEPHTFAILTAVNFDVEITFPL
jgi:hypothetical protein